MKKITVNWDFLSLLSLFMAVIIFFYGMTFYRYYPEFGILNLMALMIGIGGIALGVLVVKHHIDRELSADVLIRMLVAVLLSLGGIMFVGLILPMGIVQQDLPEPYPPELLTTLMGVVEEVLFLCFVYPAAVLISHSKIAGAVAAAAAFSVYHEVVYWQQIQVLPLIFISRIIFIAAFEFSKQRIGPPMFAHVINNALAVRAASALGMVLLFG